MKSATVDGRRRLVMPQECPPGSAVTIQPIDDNTWIVKRQTPDKNFKMVLIPVIDRLPDDPEWEKLERAFTRHSSRTITEPTK